MATTRREFIFESLALGGLAVSAPACRHHSQILIVQIYLVPEEVLGGPGKPGTPLTDPELALAEAHVKRVAIQQRLGPTSIIVVRDQPTSYTNVAGRNKPPDMKLLRHDPNGHHETVLKVWTESDRVQWQSSQPFEVIRIEKAPSPGFQAPGPGVPNNPFHVALVPYASHEESGGHVIQTSTARREANGQQYKITFRLAGRVVDPDMVCGEPPPGS